MVINLILCLLFAFTGDVKTILLPSITTICFFLGNICELLVSIRDELRKRIRKIMIDIFKFDKKYAQGKITQYSLAAAVYIKQGGTYDGFMNECREIYSRERIQNDPFINNVRNLLRDYERGFYDLKHELELLELVSSNPVES